MVAHESKFGILFHEWWAANRELFPRSASFELKDTRGASSLPFAAVEEHQADFAAAGASDGGALIRVMAGTPGAPDYVLACCQPTYYAIRFPAFFCLVNWRVFAEESAASGRRSLTEERARAIAWQVVELPGSRPATKKRRPRTTPLVA